MRLRDQVAIVTGAGGGIGSAVVKALAAEGAAVIANDYGVTLDGKEPSNAAADAAVKVVIDSGGRAFAHYGSIADFNVAQEVVEIALSKFGRLDILITPHGILRERMVFNMSETEWKDVIDVHLNGTFNLVRFASAHMRQQRSGSMVLVTSNAGLEGSAGQANYAAAKLGIVGLAYATALAMGKYDVNVNVLAPHASTRMTDRLRAEFFGDRERPDATTAAAVAVALVCPEARAITGQIYTGGGGHVARWSQPVEVEHAFRERNWTTGEVLETITSTFTAPPLARFERQGLKTPAGPETSGAGAES
ncbi:MAG TPA: SDR family NAD(P)-dependent oxidoreductase [Candidatus Dormibacteraeota bacterium]